MKKLQRCRVTLLLTVGLLALSTAGFLGRDTIYQNYAGDVWETPFFSLVFAGLHDGILPWSDVDAEQDVLWESTAGRNPRPAEEYAVVQPETEEASERVLETEGTESAQPETEETCPSTERCFVDVDESWFDDALFIGDSRTVGLRDYGGLDNAVFYATVGLNIYDLWTQEFCETDGKKCTLEEALSARRFGKIYLQVGINEMGRGTLDGFIEEFASAVAHIRELQPDAILYVQGIMCVAKEKSDTDPIFNNQAIRERNARLAELADGSRIFYIDMNEAVCDGEGNLRQELTFDDLHLYASKYDIWVDYLLTKGVGQKG